MNNIASLKGGQNKKRGQEKKRKNISNRILAESKKHPLLLTVGTSM